MGFKVDQELRRFGFVRLKARGGGVGPAGEIHHYAALAVEHVGFDRLHDIEAVAVEEISMLAVEPFELGDRRMFGRNGFGFELMQSLLDLFVIQLHRALLSVGKSIRVVASLLLWAFHVSW